MNRTGFLVAGLTLAVGVACGTSCPVGQELCDGVCADLSVDRNHCGACGSVCAGGEVCDGAGTCAPSCGDSLTECSNACVDTATDEANCGGCGTACAAGEICDGAGGCGTTCAGSLTECSGACVDTGGDEANCGACDTPCDAGEACVSGTCDTTCGTGLIACGEGCVNPMSDDTYCGASSNCAGPNVGTTCGADQACAAGDCVDIAACSLPPASGTPGVAVSAVSGTAIEGGEAVTYTLVLDAQPCDNVYVTLAPDAELTVGANMLVFTPQNWDTAQTMSVRAVADTTIDGAHDGVVSHAATSGDAGYDGVTIDEATVSIEDRQRIWHATSVRAPGRDDAPVLGTVSNDGVVAFTSGATNLVAGDTNDAVDAFTFDPATGALARWSVAADGSEADADSATARISADGAVVAFVSSADNLTETATADAGEIFRVSTSLPIAQVTPPCEGTCTGAELTATFDLSANGSVIAFSTRRKYAGAADTDTEYDVYVFTEGSDTLGHDSLSSADGNGTFFFGSNVFGPRLSSTGAFLGFSSGAQSLATPDLTVENFHAYVKNRTSRDLTRVSVMSGGTDPCSGSHQASSSNSPYLSSDGNVAAFDTLCAFTLADGTDTNAVADVLVRDIAASTTTRVSVATDGTEADGQSRIVGLSDDGNLVLFWSDATNLVADDTNEERDLFMRDLAAGTTRRISLGADYGEIASGVTTGAMSRDGSFVVLATDAALLPSDLDDGLVDLYVIALP